MLSRSHSDRFCSRGLHGCCCCCLCRVCRAAVFLRRVCPLGRIRTCLHFWDCWTFRANVWWGRRRPERHFSRESQSLISYCHSLNMAIMGLGLLASRDSDTLPSLCARIRSSSVHVLLGTHWRSRLNTTRQHESWSSVMSSPTPLRIRFSRLD